MDLNHHKCQSLSVTRNVKPVQSHHHIKDTPVTATSAQKDLGVFITSDLKWNQHVSVVCAKANKMLGFIKRSSIDIRNGNACLVLYKSMVRMAYCCQVWSPQSVLLINQVENVQCRATRYMLSLPYSSGISYKETNEIKTGLLPLRYWHEYLDMVYLFKKIVSADDPNIQIKAIRRVTRHITVKLAKLP